MGSTSLAYLGRGIYDIKIYDIKEVARLIQSGRTRVEGWTRAERDGLPLLSGELDGLFSFWDLLSLRVIAELTCRGVRQDHIARGARHLAERLQTDRPFAHEDLATVGAAFFADIAGEWEDAGLRGQLAFPDMIEPLLRPITFDDHRMASAWRPHHGVWINPAVQAGTPCVDGTRVPAQVLASLVDLDEPDSNDLAEVCDDYRLSLDEVRAALEYELALAA